MLSRRSFNRVASRLACLAMPGLSLDPLRLLAQAGSEAKSTAAADRFSVMLWTLNAGRSFAQRLEVVAKAGYRHVELVDEFQHWSAEEFTHNLKLMQSLGLTVDAIAGIKAGFANPDEGSTYLAELQALMPVAHRFGSPQIILLSGNRIAGLPPGRQHQASLETLHRAADLLAQENLTGVIEPIDTLENPLVYLDGVTEAFALTRAIGSPHLKVLYDLYHEQRNQGNLIEKLEKNLDQVGLIHVADVPGRHQPGTGEMNFGTLYGTMTRLRYNGMIAMEFYPVGDAIATLQHARVEAEHEFEISRAR